MCSEYFDTIYTTVAPSITSVTPSVNPYNTNNFNLNITGKWFGDPNTNTDYGVGTQVSVEYNAQTQNAVTVNSVNYINSTSLTANVTVNNTLNSFCTVNATSSPHFDVQVVNPDSQYSTVYSTFVVSTITVTSAYEDSTQHYLSTGTYDFILKNNNYNFEAWAAANSTVTIAFSTPADIALSSITWISSGSVRATVNIGNNVGGGPYNLTVTNPDSSKTILLSTYSITGPAITGTYEDSYQHYLSTGSYDYVLQGSNFAQWPTVLSSVTFLNASDNSQATGIKVSSVTYSSTLLRASLVLSTSNVTGGPYKLKVINPYGMNAISISTFSIATPTISGAYEDFPLHYLSTGAYDYVINGSSFAYWTTVPTSVTFLNGGSTDVMTTSVTWNAGNTNLIRASIVLGSKISSGTYTLKVQNPYGLYVTLPSTFSISSPTISHTFEDAPKHYLQTSTYVYTIQGGYFAQWPTVPSSVTFLNAATGLPTPDITVTSVNYSSTSLQAAIQIGSSVSPGLNYSIKVLNPYGFYAIQPSTFSLPAPTITNTYEDVSQHYLTTNAYDYIIKGTGFEAWANPGGSTVTVSFTGGGAKDITVSSVTYINSTSLRASIVISSYVLQGSTYSLRVVNPDGQAVVQASTFTIKAPAFTSAYEDSPLHYLTSSTYNYVVNGAFFQGWTNAGRKNRPGVLRLLRHHGNERRL